mgnify:CR=1 FL=1
MSLRNYFYRFGKYILTFFFVTLLMVLFGPLQAQAAITKAVTTDGFKLSGTETNSAIISAIRSLMKTPWITR